MTSVLVTNGLQSKSLAAVRSLGSRGQRIIVGEKESIHTSGFSKYASMSVVYPDPVQHPEAFIDWCQRLILKEKVDVILAMDDDVLNALVPRQQEMKNYCKIPLPPLASYKTASDKGSTMALARQRGVPHPKTVIPEFGTQVEASTLINLVEDLTFPLAVKPSHSSGSRGIRFAADIDELVAVYPAIRRSYPNALIQEAVPVGAKYDVGLCYDSAGQLVASYVQREVRNFPLSRGPSTVSESVTHPEILAYALKLMGGLPWCGIVEVEFMVDPRSGTPMLMEINPRTWSSLHNAILAGVDFPHILLQAALCEPLEPVHTYRAGVMTRRLFPWDLLHFFSNPERLHLDPSFFSPHIPDDILSWSDFGPTLGFLLSALRNAIRPSMWKFLIQR